MMRYTLLSNSAALMKAECNSQATVREMAHLKMRLKLLEADRCGESQRTFLAVNTLLC